MNIPITPDELRRLNAIQQAMLTEILASTETDITRGIITLPQALEVMALDRRRQKIGAQRIVGDLRIQGTFHTGDGTLHLPLHIVDAVAIVAGWTFVVSCN